MSVTVITVPRDVSRCHQYHRLMGRWEPNTRNRLEEAALKLYVERGFEQTTVAEIAREAGITERTFFRHYADKREVLFSGSAALQEVFVTTVGSAPKSASPIEAVAAALQAVGEFMNERRTHARQRQKVIAANAELQERELLKLASLAAAIAGALRERGVAEPAASLTAEAGIAVFKVAFTRWIHNAEKADLPHLLRDTMADLQAVAVGHSV
jgi:AcrR family transcriptional regulator